MMTRREWGVGWAALLIGCSRKAEPAAPPAAVPSATERLAQLERETGGRFGVAAWDLARDRRLAYRESERFLMCSTFKLPLAGAILRRVDAGQESLSRRIEYDASALIDPSPITAAHLTEGSMTVEQMCHAMVTTSDNAAANSLLKAIGGPPALTAFFHDLGDTTSRLDRYEPDLNTYTADDERDTTTAAAMLHVTRALLVADGVLSPASRQHLGDWLAAATTGLQRLRSAFPPNLRAGDKTGTGDNGATNDIAIAWRPSAKPLLVVAYSYGLPEDLDARSEVIGRVGRIVVDGLGVSE
ncbi:MAG TPA: class A beta-lactamase [Polyangiaceae bacterium]|nr:class A beta-lactamase [Polyangiaceae bacterium]